MRKIILLLLVLVLITSSSTLALQIRGDIFGSGDETNPYTFENGLFGVLEDCSVRVLNGVLWERDLAGNVIGTGSTDNPYGISGDSSGIVCIPGSYVDKVFVNAPVQRGEGSATI